MIYEAIRRLFPRMQAPRRRRPFSESQHSVAEFLESRALLTLGINFDFTVIASDLSSDLRLFGSTDPRDAPLEVIRYGSVTVSGFDGFDGGRLLSNPSDLTFEFGSMDGQIRCT